MTDLINEIDAIRAEIFSFNQNVENIKQEVENALMNLWKLQLIANDITELLRCVYNIYIYVIIINYNSNFTKFFWILG